MSLPIGLVFPVSSGFQKKFLYVDNSTQSNRLEDAGDSDRMSVICMNEEIGN